MAQQMRRTGRTRTQQQPGQQQYGQPQQSPYESAPNYQGAPGQNFDFKTSVVISTGELEDIIRGTPAKQFAYQQEVQRKNSLRQASKNRYQNWGNTLEGLREKKKRDHNAKMEEKEKNQQQLDQQEADIRERNRRAAIDKANRMLFKENDRVKSFQSSMMLSTVMQERNRQIKLKRKKKSHNQQMDAMWLQIQKENLEQQYKKEEAEEKMRKEKSMKLAKIQQHQLEEFRLKQMQERIEDIRTGERNKRMAEVALKESVEMEKVRHKKMIEQNKEYLRANVEFRRLKEAEKQLEAAEEAKILEFAEEKERLLNLRKEAEARRFKEKQDRYEKMLAKQFSHLQQLRGAENARLANQQEELEQKTQAADKAEAERKARIKSEIEASRQKQRNRKKADLKREALEDQVRLNEWAKNAKAQEDMEAAAEAKEKEDALTYQAYLNVQKAERHVQSAQERKAQLVAAEEFKRRQKEDETVFTKYAETQIADYAAKGRSVVPMKLDLMKYERAKRRVASC